MRTGSGACDCTGGRTCLTDLLLDFLLLALVAGLVLLPAGALAFSLLPTGTGAVVLCLLFCAVRAGLAGRTVVLVAALRAADAFLLLAVRGGGGLVLADLVLAGRDSGVRCLDDTPLLDRDGPAVALVLVRLIFGMFCDRLGVGENFSHCYPAIKNTARNTSVTGALLPCSC